MARKVEAKRRSWMKDWRPIAVPQPRSASWPEGAISLSFRAGRRGIVATLSVRLPESTPFDED